MKKFFKAYNRQKLIASSVMEVIVALIVCMIIFSISTSIILKSQKSNNISLKQKARLTLTNITRNNWEEYADFNCQGFEISVVSEENDSMQNICRVIVSACDNEGRMLGEKVFMENKQRVTADKLKDKNVE
ncbi:MAG: hypothetical protein A2W90_21335 [Bacteroidetes bacterium GWF2_42_66]|nr:MAG: hypothetical protein A2W92_02450 [Bacteroidetes bacterium GWA2_42_15]OFX98877.1 MAG: hypothetical protein A2W89_12970 [Bacteroidetes bacterium GWE2_42_39]OFY45592.1 MAG: hypothetical protein A2W90_21335 [Bacteroidetes bacterium GWF2_42_66]HBL77428.1 hypothetical protein [Prolixibacteraceae bacterium]HCU62408.1 hypothetical protein [Prolixibacteraceae bacterium]